MSKASVFELEVDMILEPDEMRNRMNRQCVAGEARKEMKRFNVLGLLKEDCGPSTNPVVLLKGPKVGIENYVRQVLCADDMEQANELIAQIKRNASGYQPKRLPLAA